MAKLDVYFNHSIKRFSILFLLTAFGVSTQASAQSYTITDLGAGYSNGVNSSGQAAGYNGANAVLYSNGSSANIFQGTAYAINNGGQVTGGSANGPAVVYSGGSTTTLPYLAGGEGNYASYGYAINSAGVIAGTSASPYYPHAVIWTGQTIHDLGTLGGNSSQAYGINDSGQVVGYADNTSGINEAFLYSGGVMTDLGHGEANAINNSGQVVGLSTYVPSDAFLYSQGVLYDLGGNGNFIPRSINNNGLIVGNYGNGNGYAALSKNGALINLNTLIGPSSGWTLTEASGINDAGQITGWGEDGTSGPEAFLLTPTPEPTSMAMLVAAHFLVCGRRSRAARKIALPF